MNRGDVYRLAKPPGDDPKRYRYFVVVSRDALITSKFSTVICAPVYTRHDGLSTQIEIGIAEGLRYESSVHCDALMSIPKHKLTHYVGHLPSEKLGILNKALAVALDIYADEL